MNETPQATPGPESTADDSATTEPPTDRQSPQTVEDTSQQTTEQPAADTRPSRTQRLLFTLLFLTLGLGAGFVAWQLQSEFILRIEPLAPSGLPGEAQQDLEISLYGFEFVFQAFGIPPRHSSFNVLEGPASDSPTPMPSSPDPAQDMEQMKLEAERAAKGATPRRNRVAVYLLLLGILLGAATGLAEGIRRRSILMIIGGTLACAVLAGAAGFLGGALHSRVADAMNGRDINAYVALMAPQFVAWLCLGVGLIAWPMAMNPNLKALEGLGTAAVAGGLLCSLIYVPLAQTIFFDDPLEHSLPGHVYSYLFWYLFGSGILSLLIGNACANISRHARQTAD